MKKNIILAFIVIGLAYIAIQKPQFSDEPTKNKISTVNIDTIKNITIISADQAAIKFVKKDKSWFLLINNEEVPALKSKMNHLFQLLNTESLDNFTASGEQLKQFKLLNPRLQVKYDNLTIAFGDSEPLKHRRYIFTHKKVHLIQNVFYHLLLQPENTYIKTEIE